MNTELCVIALDSSGAATFFKSLYFMRRSRLLKRYVLKKRRFSEGDMKRLLKNRISRIFHMYTSKSYNIDRVSVLEGQRLNLPANQRTRLTPQNQIITIVLTNDIISRISRISYFCLEI